MNDFHGIEEYIPNANLSKLFEQAIQEATAERNRRIVDEIKGLLAEKKSLEQQAKEVAKKLSKVNARLKGYHGHNANVAQEESRE